MYTRLARFARESGGVFVESQLVKVFLSRIGKCLLDLALPRIIMEFGGRTTLTETFAIMEQCDRALCQHDATDLVSLLVNSSKSSKAPIATIGLAEAEVDKIMYCWSYGQVGHAKNVCPLKQRQAQIMGNPKRKSVVSTNDSTREVGNYLSKQLRCSHCGRNNHAVENCFALHPDKLHSSEREKTLEVKIVALKERFKNLASFGQILDSPSSFENLASSSTLDYYMFGALGKVGSSAVETCA